MMKSMMIDQKMKWKRWMRAKIVYHKHSTRNVYLFTFFTCFHSLIFYISWDQINVVYLFRRISLSFISSRCHLISLSFHLVVISSRCHLISLSTCIIFAKWTHSISCSSMYQTKRQQTQEFQSKWYKLKQHQSKQHQSKESQSKETKEYQTKKRAIESSSKSKNLLKKNHFINKKWENYKLVMSFY